MNLSMVMIVSIFIGVPVVNIFRIKRYEKEVVKVNNMAIIIQSDEANIKVGRKVQKINKLKRKYTSLKEIKYSIQNKDVINDFLIYTIKDNLPPNVFFESITMDLKKVEIECIAKDKISIAQFTHNLNEIMYFEDVFIPKISGEEGKYNFKVSFSIKGVKDDEKVK